MRCQLLRHWSSAAILGLYLAVNSVSPVAAQHAGGGDDFAREFRPDFLRRDLQLINDRVTLGPEQQEIIRTVFQDYLETFDERALAARTNLAMTQPVYERLGIEIQARQDQLRKEIEVLLQRIQEAAETDASPEQLAAMQAQMQARIDQVRLEIDLLAEEAEATQPPALEILAAELRDHLSTWRQERTDLRNALVADVQLILSADQHENWRQALIEIRRQRLLPEGKLAGETVDVLNLVRQIGLADTGAHESILDEYLVALDEALRQREAVLDANTVPLWLSTRMADAIGAAEIRKEIVGARLAVRELHRSTIDQIVNQVDEQNLKDRIDAGYRVQAFRGLTQPSIALRLMDEAAGIAGVAPEIARAVLEQRAALARDWLDATRRLEDLTFQLQPTTLIARPAQRRGNQSEAAAAQETLEAARRVLTAIDIRGIEFVQGLLGQEAYAQLPTSPAASSLAASVRNATGSSRGIRPSERREILTNLDLNGDGIVTEAELKAAAGGG